MKVSVSIKGLDCPNCAKKLEDKINEIKILDNAKIDFLKGELTFYCNDVDICYEEIVKIVNVMEPEASLSMKKSEDKLFNKRFIIDLMILLFGIGLGIGSLFIDNSYVFYPIYILALLLIGYKTYYKAINLLTKKVINENLLLTLSVVGASLLSEFSEALMVISLYSIGKVLESIALYKSRKQISSLTNFKPEYALVYENDKLVKVKPEDVKLGSIICVRPGEKVALDGVVCEGCGNLNLQNLTGESMPSYVSKGDEVMSGSVVIDGMIEIKTNKEYEDTTVNKIINLIENANENKSKTETVISKVSRWYTLAIICLSVVTFLIVLLVLNDYKEAFYRGLIFLVVSCPCAFAISVPLTYFSGIGNFSRHGILVKGSNFLDELSKVDAFCFDKTGTLTTGEFTITRIEVEDLKYSEEDILYYMALGENSSLHPLAKPILKANHKKLVKVSELKEIIGSGVSYKYKGDSYFVGRKNNKSKETKVELYKNDKCIGRIYLKDKIKKEAKECIKNLNDMGISTYLMSGDSDEICRDVSRNLGIREYGANMLPIDKYNYIKYKMDDGFIVGYLGDGLNDSPSLKLANIGICMGISGNDLSIESSDIIITNDDLTKVDIGIKLSKYTKKIVWQNIIFSGLVKVIFLLLSALGITGMAFAVFADVGVTLIAIINSLRALKYSPVKKDIKH